MCQGLGITLIQDTRNWPDSLIFCPVEGQVLKDLPHLLCQGSKYLAQRLSHLCLWQTCLIHHRTLSTEPSPSFGLSGCHSRHLPVHRSQLGAETCCHRGRAGGGGRGTNLIPDLQGSKPKAERTAALLEKLPSKELAVGRGVFLFFPPSL